MAHNFALHASNYKFTNLFRYSIMIRAWYDSNMVFLLQGVNLTHLTFDFDNRSRGSN